MNADSTNTNATDKTPGLKRSFKLAYTIKPIDDGRNSIWSKIGAAWAH